MRCRRWHIRDVETTCRRIFGLGLHQARHLFETFQYDTICAEFLISASYAAKIRLALGLPHRRSGVTRRSPGTNGHPGISAWRTPDPVRRRVAA